MNSILKPTHSVKRMKTQLILATAIGLSLNQLHAQSVPNLMSYQGKVTDNSGVGIGSGTAVNRQIIFRIYTQAVGGIRLWSEQQTVTLSDGEFSVLLGLGVDAVYSAVTETPRPALSSVFNGGSDRYVEIVVDGGDNNLDASDTAITPRQRITSTAYAFRATTADSVANGSDLQFNGSSNYGLGFYDTSRPFGPAGVDGPVLYGVGGGALGSVNATTQVQTSALRWNGAGVVAVGTPSFGTIAATTKFIVQGNDDTTSPQQIVIRGDSDPTRTLRLGYNTMGNWGSIQAFNTSATPLMLNPLGGGVGIGGGALQLDGANSGNLVSTTTDARLYLGKAATAGYSGAILRTNGVAKFDFGTIGDDSFHIRSATGLAGAEAYTDRLVLDADGRVTVTGGILARGGSPGADGASRNGYAFKGNNGDDDSGMFSTGDGLVQFYTQNSERMRITDLGGIGIGTGTPAATVHIIRNAAVGENEALRLEFPGSGDFTQFYRGANGDHYIRSGNGTGRVYLQDVGGGNVIIGGNGPSKGKLHVAGSVNSDNGTFAFYAKNGSGQPITGGGSAAQAYGIYTDNRVAAVEFNAFSDARIKNVAGVSDSQADLAALMNIQVTDYTFRDSLKNGKGAQKKVIAQQVEKVFPLAVTKTTDVVPDIMKKADVKDGWVVLSTDLKKGEKVRLLAGKDTDKVCEVLEVKDGKFRESFDTAEKELFVYGREVSDFRSVDYDAVAMLNVSATQQIKKDSDSAEDALRKENAELRAKLAELEKRVASTSKANDATEARLAALEKLLRREAQPAARTASFKAGE